jgi:hypothetical protein
VESTTAGDALLVLVHEERAIPVQPTLGLEKAKKEQARRVEQRELAACVLSAARGRRRHAVDRDLQLAIETNSERFATEDLHPSRVCNQVAIARRRDQCAQGFGVAVDDSGTPRDERRYARRMSFAGPGADRQLATVALRRDDDPEHVRRSCRQSRGEALQPIAQDRIIADLQK